MGSVLDNMPDSDPSLRRQMDPEVLMRILERTDWLEKPRRGPSGNLHLCRPGEPDSRRCPGCEMLAPSGAARIKALRLGLDMGLREMADILGITQVQLGEVERGKATLTTVRGMVAPKLGVRRFFERITWSDDDHVWSVLCNNGEKRDAGVLYEPWPSATALVYNCTRSEMLTAARTELEAMK